MNLEGIYSKHYEKLKLYHNQFPMEIPSFSQIFTSDWNLLIETYNSVEKLKSTLFHSELICIYKTQKINKSKYLNDFHLVTTIEPCLMCSGAVIHSRLKSITYFVEHSRDPGISSLSIENLTKSYHTPKIIYYPKEELRVIVQNFFSKKRKTNSHK
jgi:tRNA(adenine34) deaminase